MKQSCDPDGTRLPIKIDSTSNGEFEPVPLEHHEKAANALAREWATEHAKRRGGGRRAFLMSSCGAATTLLAFNRANAAVGRTAGYYDVAPDAAVDPDLAASYLEGDEFIFDIQGHHVTPNGGWRKFIPAGVRPLSQMPNANCKSAPETEYGYLDCYSQLNYIKDIFLDSDTDMAVLSFIPTTQEEMPLTNEEAAETRAIVDTMDGSKRLLVHGRVNPNIDGDLERMDELAEKWKVAAWKTYTQFGPDGRGATKGMTPGGFKGYFLDDEDTGIPMIEKARKLGIRVICVHKGLSFGPESYEHSTCRDLGVVASKYPDVAFIAYHSGFDFDVAEGPYDPDMAEAGINSLIKSMHDNGLAPNGNLYAELGSTWRFLMRDPGRAAHVIGKLLKYVGEDNVLWGTDSVWYGSPQDQIQAFRAFQISEEFQEKYGYPAITPKIRAKVFGLNATVPYGISAEEVKKRASADALSRAKAAYLEAPDPHFLTNGPRNRREFLTFKALSGGHPAMG